jgi:F-type H+-transporting ATPase subunit b
MQVNWFTVIAQVLNFIVLVWLLKRFLYKPILNAIDEREKKIAGQIKDAEAKDAMDKKEQSQFQKKNELFDLEKKELMEKAIAETDEERQKLLADARNEATELSSKLAESLMEMQENLNRDIVQKTQHEVFAIAKKALSDLASMSLEEQSINIFIKRLKNLSTEENKQFVDAFQKGSTLAANGHDVILVQSAFDLPAKQQDDLKSAVNEILHTEAHFRFKTMPEIISGIELTSNGFKLAWSISEYLNSLQKTILQSLNDTQMKDEPQKPPQKAPSEVPSEVPIQNPAEFPVEVPITAPEVVPKVEPKA